METFTENTLKLGNGVYTVKDISQILQIPPAKVRYWLNTYWDGKLGKEYETSYSWKVENAKAVSFHTLIEFYVMVQFAEAGVKPREVLHAHKLLSNKLNTLFPFARKEILESIQTDGSKIYLKVNECLLTLDGSHQLNLEFIKVFFKNLDFSDGKLATRFWPLGKKKSIIVDPKRKFGHPVIGETNIYPETIVDMIEAGESISFVSALYEIDKKEIKDAIEYCNAA